ncbi:hypothetical protein IEO21_06181 [Rhodonia placenta]|uniref:Mannosyltransferase n=1 Tax=Rhodonia placenta TaxID=104341 RepID=A0A8H7P0J3_9APHY|nr:hypothetical protein IEO21_06181 [Postia placenta]
MDLLLELMLLATSWIHVFLAPYTKVEESFNLHSVHDVLMYGVGHEALPNYDHFVFPGAVPRTFIGSLSLAWASYPAILVAQKLGCIRDKSDLQIIVRLVLATANAMILCLIRRALSRRFGGPTSRFYMLLTCTQFHLPFWMGRTLPNMFALIPVNLALYFCVNRGPTSLRPSQRNFDRALALLVFTAAVFRSEIVLLLGPLALQALFYNYTTFGRLFKVGVLSGTASAAATILTDSYFWQRWPLWPELYGVYFNVIEGKSVEWGVSPFHTYFTAYLPKLLLSSLPLSVLGFLLDSRVRDPMFPALAFVLLISGLGHKEWRFVVYVVPVFNIAAAKGAAWLSSRRKSTVFGRLCFLIVTGLLCCNCLVTYMLTTASMHNYPGGEALSTFNHLYVAQENVHVHISNLAAQTGASLFLHTHAPPNLPGLELADAFAAHNWTYNKTEHLSPKALSATSEVTHLIAEMDTFAIEAVESFDRWSLNTGLRGIVKQGLMDSIDALMHPLRMVKSEKLVILERKGA